MSKNKQYAMLLDHNAGVYYGAEIKEVVLIDLNGNALVKLKGRNEFRIVHIRNIFDDAYTMYLKMQVANKD